LNPQWCVVDNAGHPMQRLVSRRHSTLAVAAFAVLSLPGCDSTHAVSAAGQSAFEVSLLARATDLVMAWHGGSGAHSVVQLQFLSARGTPSRPPIAVSDGRRDAYEPDLQAFGDQLLLGWYEKDSGGTLQAHVALLDRDGVRRWERVLSGEGRNGRNTVVRKVGGQIVVAWIESGIGVPPAIWTARLDAGGASLGAPRRAADASSDTWNLNADADSSALYLVYDARLGTRAKEVQLLRIAAEDITARTLTADDGRASVYPDLALHDGRAALSWGDDRDGNPEIYLAVGRLQDWLAGQAPHAQRVTDSRGTSMGSYVAWNGLDIGVVWSEQTQDGFAIEFQRFDALGKAGSRRALSSGVAQSLTPSIRAWHDGFALAWNDYRPGAAAETHGINAGGSGSIAMLRQVNSR
jgi:hypothetical protein